MEQLEQHTLFELERNLNFHSGWKKKRLKDVAKILNGATPASEIEEYWDGDIVWFTPDDLGKNDTKTISGSNRKITLEGYNNCGATIFSKGSIILSTRAPIGHLAISTVEGCTNQGCRGIVPTKKIDVTFLYYYLFSTKEDLAALGRGTTFKELAGDELKSFYIPLLSFKEQQRIAAYLDKRTSIIDRMIENKGRQLEKLTQLRLITITNAVTKGLDSKVKMKDSGVVSLGKIPQHWKVKRIKNLLSEDPQYGANEETGETNPNYPRYIRITDITSEGTLREETFTSLPPEIAKDYMLKKGDVLLARSGATVGKAFRYDTSWGECCFAGYLIRFVSNPKILNSDFLYLFTQSYAYDCWIKSSFIQSTIQNVSAEKYVNMRIAVPPIEEQTTILNSLQKKLSPINDLIQNVEIQMDKLMDSRKIIINDAVTGKTKIAS